MMMGRLSGGVDSQLFFFFTPVTKKKQKKRKEKQIIRKRQEEEDGRVFEKKKLLKRAICFFPFSGIELIKESTHAYLNTHTKKP
jgi:hypothetical protein